MKLMEASCCRCCRRRGVSLVESVIAIGVLAVALPLVFGALAEAGKCRLAAQAECRSSWMIPACLSEIRASREGRPQYFPTTLPGQVFPPAGEVWALAFSPDGKPVGKLSAAGYASGTGELDGKSVRYIVLLAAAPLPAATGGSPLLQVHLAVEYPALQPAAQRRKLDFLTRMP